ncbi:hypothetical protein ACSBR2_011467 [Camellia fascicularis]
MIIPLSQSTLVVPQAMDTRMLREAHDQAFAEIVGAESAIVRSQVRLILIYVSVILWGHV